MTKCSALFPWILSTDGPGADLDFRSRPSSEQTSAPASEKHSVRRKFSQFSVDMLQIGMDPGELPGPGVLAGVGHQYPSHADPQPV